LEHIQADFVTSAVLGVGGHHKSGDVRRLNGVIPRMNITPNPLAQETASDKVNHELPGLNSSSIFTQLHPKLFAGWLVKIQIQIVNTPSNVVSLSRLPSLLLSLSLSLGNSAKSRRDSPAN